MPQISEELEQLKRKIATAKAAVMTTYEFMFYSSILSKLEISFDKNLKTAATDGRRMIFGTDFLAGLTHRQTVFVLMHELMHCVYKHMERKQDRDHKLWNCAGDYVINGFLDNKRFDLLPNVLLDHTYDGMTTDEVYLDLLDKQSQDPSFNPQPDYDDLMTPPTLNGDQGFTEFMDSAIKEALASVEMSANAKEAMANVPGNIRRYWESLLTPTVDWRDVLRDFLYAVGKNDVSYRRLSRRAHSLDMILPGKDGKRMDCIDFAIDTSGSVSEQTFLKFISEIHAIFTVFNPQDIGITQFDSVIQDTRRVVSLDDFATIEFKGGGGTNVVPVFEQFKNSESKALVILTDGYFHHNDSLDPHKPVIWAIYDNPKFKPAFGQAVHFTLDD